MNDDSRPDEVFEIEPSDSGGMFAHLPWWLILTVAVVVTELTAHPSIGVIVLCFKFGWNDFRTAHWLRRRDPNRRRGAVCSWFYLSSGLWRVCSWSFALMFIAIIFFVATEPPQARPANRPNADPDLPPEVMTCMAMWMGSFVVATLLTLLSVCFAWRRPVKVWISRSVSESRRLNEWPPRPAPRLRPDPNLLNCWMVSSGAGLFVLLFIIGVAALMASFDAAKPLGPAGNNQWADVVFGVIVGVFVPIGSAFLILVFGGMTFKRIGAGSPTECWPANEPTTELGSSD
ncbi:hypothetical protein LBMAG52_28180 [Planctomycetia bacterium]|nr:hypothetical protein LBMAG52_28180 [Planctomycetia bacterium]